MYPPLTSAYANQGKVVNDIPIKKKNKTIHKIKSMIKII